MTGSRLNGSCESESECGRPFMSVPAALLWSEDHAGLAVDRITALFRAGEQPDLTAPERGTAYRPAPLYQ
jgi:hypothetical protein